MEYTAAWVHWNGIETRERERERKRQTVFLVLYNKLKYVADDVVYAR